MSYSALMTKEPTMRQAFQFTVRGTEQAGVIYVTLSFTDRAEALIRATKIAAKRSGDPAPKFVRTVAPSH